MGCGSTRPEPLQASACGVGPFHAFNQFRPPEPVRAFMPECEPRRRGVCAAVRDASIRA